MKKLLIFLGFAVISINAAAQTAYNTLVTGTDGTAGIISYWRDNNLGTDGFLYWKNSTKQETTVGKSTYLTLLFNGSTSDYVRGDGSVAAFPTASRSVSYPTRTLNSAFQPSSVSATLVTYSVDVACTLSLTTGQTGTVFLESADDSGFTTNVVEICRFVNGNTGTLTIGLNLTQNGTGTLSGYVPAGKYVRLRTANTVGTPTFNYRSGQEVVGI